MKQEDIINNTRKGSPNKMFKFRDKFYTLREVRLIITQLELNEIIERVK